MQDPIVGLQAFLAEMPEGVALVGADYHRWAQEHNERRARGEARALRLIERPSTLWRRLFLPWDEMLRVARGEVTMAEARAAILDSCELASHPQVQAIFGEAHPERWPGFPDPLPLMAWRWWRDDLRAYKEGKGFTDEDMRASRARYKAEQTREQREAWGAEVVAWEKRRRAQLAEGEPTEAVREREERVERMRHRAKERQAVRAEMGRAGAAPGAGAGGAQGTCCRGQGEEGAGAARGREAGGGRGTGRCMGGGRRPTPQSQPGLGRPAARGLEAQADVQRQAVSRQSPQAVSHCPLARASSRQVATHEAERLRKSALAIM